MKRVTATAIACAFLLAAGAALAQQGPMSGAGRGPGMMGQGGMGSGMMGQGMMGRGMYGAMGTGPMGNCMMTDDGGKPYIDGRLAFLKAELSINDAQKSQWDAYAAALKKNFENMQSMRQSMMATMTSTDGSPVERLDLRLTAMEGRLAVLKEMKPVLAALYGALSDDQKKKANELLTGMGCMM